ncbi:hypothetical protein ACROYT_G021842 [Oculina patagonica]
MATSEEEEGVRNLQNFQRQKLPWLRTFLQDRGIQTSSEGKCKRKAELVELAFNAYAMKLVKVSEGEGENENLIMAELLATDEGVLPDPASILKSNWNGHVLDLQVHKVPDKSAVLVKYQVQPTERSKRGSGKDSYDGIMILRSKGAIHGAFCPCQGGADGTCRHVAAVLFDIRDESKSSTRCNSNQ